MIPAGYMAKRVSSRPEWLNARQVRDIYSVSDCVSKNFADYVDYWKHNGYWFFDSPDIIKQIAKENSIDLTGTSLFYYEVYERQFNADGRRWEPFAPEAFETQVIAPVHKSPEGYDVANFYAGSTPECSLLSCNHMAETIETNPHCLLPSVEIAKSLLESGTFDDCEPGPYRIFAVYSVAY
jgi:hypothetical protein